MKRIILLLFVFLLSARLADAQAPVLTANSISIPQGLTGEVTYSVVDYWNICNFNGTITWDPTILTFSSITYYAPPLVTYPGNFNTSQVANGILSFTWAHPLTVGATIPDGNAFIKITFLGSGVSGSTSALDFSNVPEPLYWYNFAAWSGTITTVAGIATITAGNPDPPVADFTIEGTGLYRSFTSTSTGNPLSYQWSFGDGNTSILQNPTHTYAAYGTYQVCLTATSPAGSDSTCHIVYATMTVGIEDNSFENIIKVYAEPESHVIHIDFMGKIGNTLVAEVFSLQGQQLLSQSIPGGHELKMNASSLKQGIYFIRLRVGGELYMKKLFLK